MEIFGNGDGLKTNLIVLRHNSFFIIKERDIYTTVLADMCIRDDRDAR